MANESVIGIVSVLLRARNELTPALRRVEADVARLRGPLRKHGESLTNIGQRSAAASLAISAGIAGAAATFLSFEERMNQVRAVSGATNDQFAALTSQAKDLGSTTAHSASAAAEGMGFLAQAGFQVNEIVGAMPGVLNLASAAQIELGTAADITSNVLSGYGIAVEDLARVNDVLVGTFTTSNVNLTQLGLSFQYAGPLAKAAGLEFEQTAALIGIMGNAGIQGAKAGTALRGAISRLLKPSKEAEKVIEDFGLQILDASGRLLPFDRIITQLEPHVEDTAGMITLFGQETVAAMSFLAGEGGQSVRDYTDDLRNAGGVTDELVKVQLAGLTGAWVELKSAGEGFLIEVGQRFGPILKDIAIAVTGLLAKFRDDFLPVWDRLGPSTQKIITAMGIAAGIFAPVAIAVGTLMTVMAPLAGAFATVVGAVAAVANPITIVIAAVAGAAGLAVAFWTLIGRTKEGSRLLTALGAFLRASFVMTLQMVRRGFDFVVTVLKEAWKWVKVLTSVLIAMIPPIVLKALDWLAEKIEGVTAAASSWTQEQKDAREAADNLTNATRTGQAAVDAMMASYRVGTTTTEAVTVAVDDLAASTVTATVATKEFDDWLINVGIDLQLSETNVYALDASMRAMSETAGVFIPIAYSMRDGLGAAAEGLALVDEKALLVIPTMEQVSGVIEEASEKAIAGSLLAGLKTVWSPENVGALVVMGILNGTASVVNAATALGTQAGTKIADALGAKLTGMTDKMGGFLGKALGGAINFAMPLIGPLLGKAAGWIAGKLFGAFKKPSEAEQAGRQSAQDFRDAVTDGLTQGQLDEAAEAAQGAWRGNEAGAQFLIGVRDAYIAAGLSAQQAERDVNRLWAAEKEGGDAAQEVADEIQANIDAGTDAAQQGRPTRTTDAWDQSAATFVVNEELKSDEFLANSQIIKDEAVVLDAALDFVTRPRVIEISVNYPDVPGFAPAAASAGGLTRTPSQADLGIRTTTDGGGGGENAEETQNITLNMDGTRFAEWMVKNAPRKARRLVR